MPRYVKHVLSVYVDCVVDPLSSFALTQKASTKDKKPAATKAASKTTKKVTSAKKPAAKKTDDKKAADKKPAAKKTIAKVSSTR